VLGATFGRGEFSSNGDLLGRSLGSDGAQLSGGGVDVLEKVGSIELQN